MRHEPARVAALLRTAFAWPLAARAQQAASADHWVPGHGCFGLASMDDAFVDGCVNSLDRCRTIAIEYRWSQGRPEHYTELRPSLCA